MKKTKLYIFNTGIITGVGGGQIYILNKSVFLESLGWKICIFSSLSKGNIMYSELTKYKSLLLPELNYYINYFPKGKRYKILSKMINSIDEDYDEIVIESHEFKRAEWGELLAEKIKGKHIIYSLSENNRLGTQKEFLYFKLKRKELAGISPNSILPLFKEYKLSDFQADCYLPAALFSINLPKEINSSLVENLPKANYNIGYFGRANKKGFKNIVSEVIRFSKMTPEKTINFVILGYTPAMNKETPDFFVEISQLSNINLHYWAVMDIVPKSFFRKMDVVIASSGSARISAMEGTLTLTLDVNDSEPIGILGITTLNRAYRSKTENQIKPISQWLLKILKDKKYTSDEIDISTLQIDNLDKLKFIQFIDNSEKSIEYFRFKYNFRGYIVDDLKAFFSRLLGIRIAKYLR